MLSRVRVNSTVVGQVTEDASPRLNQDKPGTCQDSHLLPC